MKKLTLRFIVVTLVLSVILLSACGPASGSQAPAATLSPDEISALVANAIEKTEQAAASPTADYKALYNALQSATPTAPTIVPLTNPTFTPAPASVDTSDYEGTAACEDGKNTTPLFFEQPTDVPWGTKEGATVAQIAWKPGDGFAGWFRIVAIAERILGIEMPYANNILTLYVTQYCGALVDIKNEARNHVTAMVNSSQNSAGDRPSPDEIPIVLLKRDGSIEWVVQAPNGPSLTEIEAHLEMRP